MIPSQKLINAWNKILLWNGNQISLKYYYQIYDDVYDDPTDLVQSGNTLWTSGIIFPVEKGTDDAVLLEQGKISMGDSKIYFTGSLDLSSLTGSVTQLKIGVGSPSIEFYSLIIPGTAKYTNRDYEIYKKAYIRKLPNGSLIGEN